ncbi:hypothetical protein pEaSNUABM22_00025 [Erwinia phage pEa_SNUABM_22]|uniref:Uncharacterized protein n=1 Tax=Erwinia phage pEa_SNUABM_22 TaxID=2869549 RepID=A0AAE9BV81_9CAUD|nr:hypothetical protein MPK63_gp025 [Erwinia phage pEa_SNUABM_22]UAW96513.1 hypothetical protein pEaSNUABM22_00025 [Erwinia phage pEa_SNUABM_22]
MSLDLLVPPIGLERIEYRNYNYDNVSLNILNIISVVPSAFKSYPDNEGTPSIAFEMRGREKPVHWIIPKGKYGANATALRDRLLHRLQTGGYSHLVTADELIADLQK